MIHFLRSLSGRWVRRRLVRWCRRQDYRLLRFRDAKLFEGPSSWTIKQRHYRIQVVDGEGHRHGGFLMFRRWWSPVGRAHILWDEAALVAKPALALGEGGQRPGVGHWWGLSRKRSIEDALHSGVAAPAREHR